MSGSSVSGRGRGSVGALLFAGIAAASCAKPPTPAVAPLGRAPSAFVAYVERSGGVESLVFLISAGLAAPRPDPIGVRVVPGLLAEVPVNSPSGGTQRLAVAVNTGKLAMPASAELESLWAFRCRGLSDPADSCTVTTETTVTIETRFATPVATGIRAVSEQRVWVGSQIGEPDRPCACIHLPYLDHEIFVAEGLDDAWELDSLRESLGNGASAPSAGGEGGEGGDDNDDNDDNDGSVNDDECDDGCSNGECTFVTLASILGGTIQALEEYENVECRNRQISADVERWPMSTSPPTDLPTWARGVPFVETIRIDGDGADVPWKVPIGSLDDGAGQTRGLEDASTASSYSGETDTDGDGIENDTDPFAAPCVPMDGELYSLHRGMLVRSTVGLDQWVSCTWHEVARATPTNCPTADDPCGDPALFPTLATAEPATDFWVANDGSAALVWSAPPHLLTRPSVPSDGVPVQVAVAFPGPGSRGGEAPRGTLLGVHYYADAGPVQAAMGASQPEAERAFEWLPWPLALGNSGAVRAPAGRPMPPTDAAGVVDRGDGKGWGNHCFSEFKAGRTQAAFDACEYALTVATSPPTRAAIFHSLGLIAGREGNEQAAIACFRTSLELRNHETTRGALRALLAELTDVP